MLNHDWIIWARDNQYHPCGFWKTWLMLGGRGSGKTRAGAEWVKAIATSNVGEINAAAGRIALLGETYHDVRDVMIEGQSGLLSVHTKAERPTWSSSLRKLEWQNGTIAQVFSANDPDCLRGSQFGAAWSDEICKWKSMEESWDMLQFALRLGNFPRQVVTTTPKPSKFLMKLMAQKDLVVDRSTTHENRGNLAKGFLDHVLDKYGNTSLGRQELLGEIIAEREDALWNRKLLKNALAKPRQPWRRIVVAVDPPATSGKNSAACGIVAAGHDADGTCFVIADKTVERKRPNEWAAMVVQTYHELAADIVVAEQNQGGEMVETILQSVDPSVAVRSVNATRNKWTRAEPVALLYERGKVKHVSCFPELEDQMCTFGGDSQSKGRSPDRLDALVWAVGELELGASSRPRIRKF